MSIEEHARQQEKKKAGKREAKLRRREAAAAAEVRSTGGSMVEPGRGRDSMTSTVDPDRDTSEAVEVEEAVEEDVTLPADEELPPALGEEEPC